MAITPRENLLKCLSCDSPQWIPVCPDLFPNQNPTAGIPTSLEAVFRSNDIIKLGEYWGADEFMLPVSRPAFFHSETCSVNEESIAADQKLSILSTPRGDLRQVTSFPDGSPSLVTERYVKTKGDVLKLIAYFESLQVQSSQEARQSIKETSELVGSRGILFCRTVGTPLGMCYRVYSNLVDLIYLMTDNPSLMGDLFACMEEKYLQLYERMLRESPEIDAFFGMDDTSTTVISPAMFEECNVQLTNNRADLCHRFGKLYMHHSCGLIHDLLPMYRKTIMNGIDGFTTPPIGDVGFAEGRKILGPGYSVRTSLPGGLPSLEKEAIDRHLKDRFEDAKAAQHVAFHVGGSHLTFPAMEMIFKEAQKMKYC